MPTPQNTTIDLKQQSKQQLENELGKSKVLAAVQKHLATVSGDAAFSFDLHFGLSTGKAQAAAQ